MSRCQQVGGPILRSVRATHFSSPCGVVPVGTRRQLSSTATRKADAAPSTPAAGAATQKPAERAAAVTVAAAPAKGDAKFNFLKPGRDNDPNRVMSSFGERIMLKKGKMPIGSRRRRAAINLTLNIPFEKMPYQCFQEARKILNADRQEKIEQIIKEQEKIHRIEATDAGVYRDGEYHKQKRLKSLRNYVEYLKIQADMNDPMVKKKLEDGNGDFSKPIYRHLANRKWRAYEYKITQQRISQFHIVPDVLPKFDPVMDVTFSYRGYKVQPGTILDSRVTEEPPVLRMQCFDSGERLLTIVLVDADVPNPETDSFNDRLHYLAANIPWDPTKRTLPITDIGHRFTVGGAVPVPWLPPTAQKGSPYHRLALFVLEQLPRGGDPLDPVRLASLYASPDARARFSLKSLRDKFDLVPVGFTMFRTEWDDHMADVMARHKIPGADIEFRRRKWKSLRVPRKARGWEAKRQGPKYKFLWRYTKRLRS